MIKTSTKPKSLVHILIRILIIFAIPILATLIVTTTRHSYKTLPLLESYTQNINTPSTYAKEQLPEYLHEPYEKMANAILSMSGSASFHSIPDENLEDIIYAVFADYPIIDWVAVEYSSSKNLFGKETVFLSYTKSRAEVNNRLTSIDKELQKLKKNINPQQSDFDKVTILHDELVSSCEYDLDEPEQANLFGALVTKKATCEGYAKAYQFLINNINLQAITVYGTADGPHAWNKINFDGGWFFVDATFDDRDLEDGTTYLSHDYFLLSDNQSAKTHSEVSSGNHFPVAKCDKADSYYFTKKDGIFITQADFNNNNAEDIILNAIKNSARLNETVVQIKFENEQVAKLFIGTDISRRIDLKITDTIKGSSFGTYKGRSFNPDTSVLTFLISY